MQEQHLGDHKVKASTLQIQLSEVAAANLHHIARERLDPVRLEIDRNDRPRGFTRFASHRVMSPPPAPTSRQRQPADTPAALRTSIVSWPW